MLVGAIGPGLIVWVWADDRVGVAWRVIGTALGLCIATVGYIFPVLRFLQRTFAGSSAAKNETGRTIRRMLLGACLSGVALIGTWGSAQWSMTWAGQLTQGARQNDELEKIKTEMTDATSKSTLDSYRLSFKTAIWRNPREYTQIFTSCGAIVGTILAAMLGD